MHGGLSPELQHFDQASIFEVSESGGKSWKAHENTFHTVCNSSLNLQYALWLLVCKPISTSINIALNPQIRKIVRPTDVPDSGLVCDLPGPHIWMNERNQRNIMTCVKDRSPSKCGARAVWRQGCGQIQTGWREYLLFPCISRVLAFYLKWWQYIATLAGSKHGGISFVLTTTPLPTRDYVGWAENDRGVSYVFGTAAVLVRSKVFQAVPNWFQWNSEGGSIRKCRTDLLLLPSPGPTWWQLSSSVTTWIWFAEHIRWLKMGRPGMLVAPGGGPWRDALQLTGMILDPNASRSFVPGMNSLENASWPGSKDHFGQDPITMVTICNLEASPTKS